MLGVKCDSQNGIYTIDPLRDDRWPEFTDRNPSASVFHTRGWMSALKASYGYDPVVITTCPPDEELRNAVSSCIVRSWLTGTRLVSMPFSDHCEPLVDSPEEFRRLSAHTEAVREKEGWRYVEMRSANPLLDFSQEFVRSAEYALHQLDLRPPLEVLYKELHKDCITRKIARAKREVLHYEEGTSAPLLRKFYGLLELTRARHYIPLQPFVWFQNIVACMGKDVCIRIASKDNRPIAGIMTLSHRKTMVYKYGGSDAQFNNLGATPMLFWHAITEAKDRGMERLDFGRSDLENTGLITFKQRWGATRSTITNWRVPAKSGSLSRERFKVRLAQQVGRWIPHGWLNLVGRVLYRHIG